MRCFQRKETHQWPLPLSTPINLSVSLEKPVLTINRREYSLLPCRKHRPRRNWQPEQTYGNTILPFETIWKNMKPTCAMKWVTCAKIWRPNWPISTLTFLNGWWGCSLRNQPIARIAASARRRLMQDGLRTCSRSVTSARHPRRTERRNRSIYIIYEDSCYLPTQAHGRAERIVNRFLLSCVDSA